jgi:hypothetical protein
MNEGLRAQIVQGGKRVRVDRQGASKRLGGRRKIAFVHCIRGFLKIRM